MDSTRRVWLAALLAGLALACKGGSDEAPSAAPPPAEPTQAAAPATRPAADDPAAMARLEGLYEWDHASGPARDLQADTRTCASQSLSPGLRGVAEHMQCMRELGWKTVQPEG